MLNYDDLTAAVMSLCRKLEAGNLGYNMKGCRPLTTDEATIVKGAFSGRNADRDRALFLLGINTGFRISELLSLRVMDVVTPGGIVATSVTVARKSSKGRRQGRTVALNQTTRALLTVYVNDHKRSQVEPHALLYGSYLFTSERDPEKPIDRVQAWRVLENAFAAARRNRSTRTERGKTRVLVEWGRVITHYC